MGWYRYLHFSLSPILLIPILSIHVASLARSALEIHTYRNIKPCGGHRTTSVKARR